MGRRGKRRRRARKGERRIRPSRCLRTARERGRERERGERGKEATEAARGRSGGAREPGLPSALLRRAAVAHAVWQCTRRRGEIREKERRREEQRRERKRRSTVKNKPRNFAPLSLSPSLSPSPSPFLPLCITCVSYAGTQSVCEAIRLRLQRPAVENRPREALPLSSSSSSSLFSRLLCPGVRLAGRASAYCGGCTLVCSA